MKYCYSLLLFLSLALAGRAGFAQELADKRVSGQFVHTPFAQVASQLENQTGLRFYFDPAAVDSVFITLQVQDQPVRVVLAQALQGTGLQAVFDTENRVFVLGGAAVTALPATFFAPRSAGITAQALDSAQVAVSAPSQASRRPREMSPAEFKVYEIGDGSAGGRATLAGHLRAQKSGEPIIGAAVYSESPSVGTTTDQFGYYSLTLPTGRYDLKIRGVGIKNTRRQVVLRGTGQLEIEVEEDVVQLKEVVVEAEKDKNVSGLQMGLEKLDIKTMRQVPSAFGETDLLRVVLTLPGVKSVGEGSTGLNVRGGATDQNLILFNDAMVYNPAHLFGFFSAFNPDMVRAWSCTKVPFRPSTGGGCRRCSTS